MPKMIPVESSAIQAVGYDDDAEELHVRYSDSGLYIYHGVPRDVFEELMLAPSKGAFINGIKDEYRFSRE
jgi:hypothetical protein